MGKDIFSKKSRFSIRKLNIGVCSVLLGTLIMIGHTDRKSTRLNSVTDQSSMPSSA